jgi:MFS-type transporter involved in bile tolerance (Atg22 family)
MVPGFVFISLGLVILASGAQWQWSLASFIAGFLWIHGSQSITAGSMQVLGSDMAPAAARGRFFGFWRLIGEVGGLVSPAQFAIVAEQVAYSAAFARSLCPATAALLAFYVQETVGHGKL